MARSSKPKPEDMMVVNVEDFLAQAQALGKQTEFIAAVLKHSEAICGTDWKAVAEEVGMSGGAKKGNFAKERFGRIADEFGFHFVTDADDNHPVKEPAYEATTSKRKARIDEAMDTEEDGEKKRKKAKKGRKGKKGKELEPSVKDDDSVKPPFKEEYDEHGIFTSGMY